MRALTLVLIAMAIQSGCATGGSGRSKPCLGQCTLLVTNRGGVPLVIEAGSREVANREVGVVQAGGVLTAVLPHPPTRVLGTYTHGDLQRHTTICRYDSRVEDELRYTCEARGVVRRPG